MLTITAPPPPPPTAGPGRGFTCGHSDVWKVLSTPNEMGPSTALAGGRGWGGEGGHEG